MISCEITKPKEAMRNKAAAPIHKVLVRLYDFNEYKKVLGLPAPFFALSNHRYSSSTCKSTLYTHRATSMVWVLFLPPKVLAKIHK